MEENIVYVLLDDPPYMGCWHHGVFSTEEAAMEYINTLKGEMGYLSLYKHTLDKPEEEGVLIWPK